MPIYRWECTNPECYHIDEVYRPFRLIDEPVVCSKCGNTSIRVMTAPGMIFVPGSWKNNVSAQKSTGRHSLIKHPTREKNG